MYLNYKLATSFGLCLQSVILPEIEWHSFKLGDVQTIAYFSQIKYTVGIEPPGQNGIVTMIASRTPMSSFYDSPQGDSIKKESVCMLCTSGFPFGLCDIYEIHLCGNRQSCFCLLLCLYGILHEHTVIWKKILFY